MAQSEAAKQIEATFLSTDDLEMAAIGEDYGAIVPGLRPVRLAGDDVSTEAVMLDAYHTWWKDDMPDAVVLLQPTSPIRLDGVIDSAITKFLDCGYDSMVSVVKTHKFLWQEGNPPTANYDYQRRPRRQDISNDDCVYQETGSIYITKTEVILEEKCRLGGNIGLFEMSDIEQYEIDSRFDFQNVEILMTRVD